MPALRSRLTVPLLVLVVLLAAGIPPALAQTPVGTVRGRVVAFAGRAPLPGATVIVQGTEPLVGTTTDADGAFVLPRVPLGRHDVEVRFVGFEPAVLRQVLVTSGKEVVLEVALREQVVAGAEVVVTPGTRRDAPHEDLAYVSARTFAVEETRRYAGGLDDPARMASAFAGVATGGGIAENALTIRGNAPKGVLWRLEGVEIPNPNHFAGLSVAGGGGLTLFSGQLLAGGDVLTGAFPAPYGNALSGVVDLDFRTGNPAAREHTVQAGVLGVEAASEGPFVRGAPATYLFNVRYSTIGLLLPILPTEDVATYGDAAFSVDLPTRRHGRIALWGLGGLDGQTMSATDDPAKWEYETWDRLAADLSLAVGAAGVRWDVVLGRRTALRATAAVTGNRTRLDQERLGDDLVLREDLRLHSTTARLIAGTHVSRLVGSRHSVRTGATVQRLVYDLEVAASPAPDAPLASAARGDGASTLLQVYAASEVALAARWSASVGLHVQHFALTGATSPEPRLSLRWAAAPGQAVTLGYGLHSQVEDLRFYAVAPEGPEGPRPNAALGLARAHHLVLSYDRRLGDGARLEAEAYAQALFDVPVIADSSFALLNFEQDFTFRDALVNDGAGRNVGLEVTLERFLRDGWYALATGSLFRSRYRGGDGVWRPTRFDRGYAANVLVGREVAVGTSLLGLNGRLNVLGGRRRSPVDEAASRAAEEVVYDAYRAFADREPALVVADLTVTYRRNHARWSEVWALQVKNVLGAKTVGLDYNYATERVEDVREGFPLPVLSYKVEF